MTEFCPKHLRETHSSSDVATIYLNNAKQYIKLYDSAIFYW